jgi:hypothetical protein
MEAQRDIILATLTQGVEITPAWEAFGRLIHAAQDFYAHSNYVELWAHTHPPKKLPPPIQIEARQPEILAHPALRSGKIYFWDWLAFVPGLYTLACRLLPEDSHTNMNLDHPKRGALFPYAVEAAIKRTFYEYQYLADQLDETSHLQFIDRV